MMNRSSGTGCGVDIGMARGGIHIGGQLVPLTAGAVHYWRLAPSDWRSCLQAVRDLGLRFVDVYVPWAVHELEPGCLDLGQVDPRCDVRAFLRLAQQVGLYAIVRPGPHINAELTGFGLPERVLWRADCQARSPQGSPVMLPAPPRAFPVPSHASRAYLDEASGYLRAIGVALAPLCHPDGPIVLVQIDNEGALFFRDGAYDQDYHPDAVARYRAFVQRKYGDSSQPAQIYGDRRHRGPLQPPVRFDAEGPGGLARHLDWVEFQEEMIADALTVFRDALAAGGLGGLPTTHNLPMLQETTPLNAGRLGEVVDLVGLDFYGVAGEAARRTILRRTSELALWCDSLQVPLFACEMGAGYPPYFPPLSEADNAFTVLTALAYGVRGFNVFMAVERDRWIGAPIDRRGRRRPSADFWCRLCAAVERAALPELRRQVPVRLLLPRTERRLARVLNAFGPLTGAVLSLLGAGPREACRQLEVATGQGLVGDADSLARSWERALDERGVPFAWTGGEYGPAAAAGARWIICVSSGAVAPSLLRQLRSAAARGTRVTFGPGRPRFDDRFRALTDEALLSWLAQVEVVDELDHVAADAALVAGIAALGLPKLQCDPEYLRMTVHEDDEGVPRVVFVINATEEDADAELTLPGERRTAVDLLDQQPLRCGASSVQLHVPARSVKMLGLG